MLKNVLGTGGMESSDKAGGYSNSIDKKNGIWTVPVAVRMQESQDSF